MDLPLKAKSYSKYGWNICVDLQVTGLLLGMQFGLKKLRCFLCEWDILAKDKLSKFRIDQCEKTQFQGKSVSENNC
jgi:hypothetical protein